MPIEGCQGGWRPPSRVGILWFWAENGGRAAAYPGAASGRSEPVIPQPLKIIAARYSLGLVMMSDELCHAADAALDASLYSPSLAEVATTVHPLMSEVGPLFERAIQELGGALPSHEEAVRILLVDSIDSIASRKVSPRKGLERMLHEAYYLSGVEEKVGS